MQAAMMAHELVVPSNLIHLKRYIIHLKKHRVTYCYKATRLDVQETGFAACGLEMISPAQLGFLRAKRLEAFEHYSKTNADVFYEDRGNSQVIIVPSGILSKRMGLSDLAAAYSRGQEYFIPPSQRDWVYAVVDEMLSKGTAFTARHGKINIPISEFGQIELTSKLFSDEILGIEAQEYGDFLDTQCEKVQSLFFDPKDYAKSQKGPYLNRLRIYGPGGGFDVLGHGGLLKDSCGAFAVRFDRAA